MNDAADAGLEALKRQAQCSVDLLIASQARMLDAAITMGNWLLASLVAANGGGALAVINGANKLASPAIPGSLFVAGLVLAMVNGGGQQYVALKASTKLGPMIGYWINVASSGDRDEATEADYAAQDARIARYSTLSAVPGWLSALCFVAGAISLGVSLKV